MYFQPGQWSLYKNFLRLTACMFFGGGVVSTLIAVRPVTKPESVN